MRASLVLAALLIAGCKDKPKQEAQTAQPSDPHGSAARDAGAPAPPIDWAACDAAVTKAASAPLNARPQILIDGCRVCGDWTPILRWNTLQTDGGPKRIEIENAMLACNAYCVGEAKLKFLGTLDDARGKSSRMPWKQLAILCKDRVSAEPDGRFLDGSYFALDRIARAIGTKGGDLATRAGAIELPLPAVSVVGTGPPLAPIDERVATGASELQITLLGGTISVGTMPRARLTKGGIKVDLGPDGYPGKTVTVKELGAALKALAGDDRTRSVAILMPSFMPARGLEPIIAAASAVMPVYLAARARVDPADWELPGSIPIALENHGPKVLKISAKMSVQGLASALARLALDDVKRVGITSP